MSLFSTFLLFLRTPRLAEKRSGRPGYLYRQSGIIRFSVFSAITIQPQLFDAKSLLAVFAGDFENGLRRSLANWYCPKMMLGKKMHSAALFVAGRANTFEIGSFELNLLSFYYTPCASFLTKNPFKL